MSRIQNSMTALNTHRQYTMSAASAAESAKKVSSGFRINSAADDAAGLAISEKMRNQVRGLNMAAKNSQDAISMVQTAEGALEEVQNILRRMNELAIQSNTGTNEELDRDALQQEFAQLKEEVTAISQQTTFNNMPLFDGEATAPEASVVSMRFNPIFQKGESVTIADIIFTFGDKEGQIKGDNAQDQAKNLAAAIEKAGIGDVVAQYSSNGVRLVSASGMPIEVATSGVPYKNDRIAINQTDAKGQISLQFSNAKPGAVNQNFKQGDILTAPGGGAFTFGSGKNEIPIGSDLTKSVENAVKFLNQNATSVEYDNNDYTTRKATGNWTFSENTLTATFVANDSSVDFSKKTPDPFAKLEHKTAATGGLAVNGEQLPTVETGTYTISSGDLVPGNSLEIGGQKYLIENAPAPNNTKQKLELLKSKIDADPNSTARASVTADGKLKLEAREVGGFGEVKITTPSAIASTTFELTSPLGKGDSIRVGDVEITYDMLKPANSKAAQSMKIAELVATTSTTINASYLAPDIIVKSKTPGAKEITAEVKSEALNGAQVNKVGETINGAATKTGASWDLSGITGEFKDGETIKFGGKTITFGNGAGKVAVGATKGETFSNLANYMNTPASGLNTINSVPVDWAVAGGKLTVAADTAGTTGALAEAQFVDFKFSDYRPATTIRQGSGALMADPAVYSTGTTNATITYDLSALTDNFAKGETIHLNGKTFTFGDSNDFASGTVKLGADIQSTMGNLVETMNSNGGSTAVTAGGTHIYNNKTNTHINGCDGIWTYALSTDLAGNNTRTLEWKNTAVGPIGTLGADPSNYAPTDYRGDVSKTVGATLSNEAMTAPSATSKTFTAGEDTKEPTFSLDVSDLIATGKNFTAGDALLVDGVRFSFSDDPVATGTNVTIGADITASINTLVGRLNGNALTQTVGGITGTWANTNGKVTFTGVVVGQSFDNTQTGITNFKGSGSKAGVEYSTVDPGADEITTLNAKEPGPKYDEPAFDDSVIPKSDNFGKRIFDIQVGANDGDMLTISISNMSAKGLGIDELTIEKQGLSAEETGTAAEAMKIVKEAINIVSTQRGDLGAAQNRLTYKIKNLKNTSENLQAAESNIRDADIAQETTTMQKHNIINQAATAMLAQANTMSQNVLSLLK